jgi:hypothetical protein
MRAPRFACRLLAGALTVLGIGSTAGAVTLNPRGLGQVLIYPYYTVNAGFGTLLSIVNTTPHGKALKVRFHEGYNGRVVAAFNLYLSPFDTWVGQVFDTGTGVDSVAALATNDRSCVAPAFLLPVDPGSGPPRLNFDAGAYKGANADGGPATQARTHEGYLDVIEMGEVTNTAQNTLTAITHVNGVPANCAQVVAAWATPGGYWTLDPTIDLAPPTGGLYGAASIINVAQGLMYTLNASAIDGFSSIVQHGAPAAATPDLNTGSPNAGAAFAAYVAVGSKLVEADFNRSEDAISALFTADNLFNEYVVSPGLGAQSDWIVTLPTKRFYTDPALLFGAAVRAPFDNVFSSASGGTSCSPIATQFWNREEQTIATGYNFFSCGGCPPPPQPAVCFASNAFTIGSALSALGSKLVLQNAAYTTEIDLSGVGFQSGWLRVDLRNDITPAPDMNHQLVTSNGSTLFGLPALGFLALDYVNGNVTPGVLANYSGAYPHRAHVTCEKTADPQTPC